MSVLLKEIKSAKNDDRVSSLNVREVTRDKFEQIKKRLGLSQYLLLDYIADHILENIDNIIITQNGIVISDLRE